jgi:predicted nucleotidyltransferase
MSLSTLLGEVPEELARLGLVPASCRAIYATGSLVRGWGNSGSDLDLVVVLSEPWVGTPSPFDRIGREPDFVQLVKTDIQGRNCDIEFWQEALVERLLSKVSWPEFKKGQAQERQLMIYEINFLDRLAYALPVLDGDMLESWRARLRESAFRAMRVKYWLHEARHYNEDALGQLAADDVCSAVLSARLAFNSAVDAMLARYGELSQNAKWRARRFRAASPPALPFDTYWEIETMQKFNPAEPQRWVDYVIELVINLSRETQAWLTAEYARS